MSRDKNDQGLRDMAKGLGFPDYETAQRAPVALLGTPDEVKREIAHRIKDTGVTYFIMVVANELTNELFVKEVMPEFA
jgi:alkanesulfonate monooxygenase SsuD/methylene tetrahydromethanopterin reductase-like flavin-dependent oxidoreductase (luciferase family)